MKLKATAGGAEIDDGVYESTLVSITVVEGQEGKGTGDDYLRWEFCVFDDPESDEGTPLIGNSSMSFGPKSKARGWIHAILGRSLKAGEEIDTDALALRACQVVVKKDPDSGFTRIMDVLAPRVKRGNRQPVSDTVEL